MKKYETRALDTSTWQAFANLVEANNGVWGGCWCMWYHGNEAAPDDDPTAKRQAKERLVREGKAHAALVFDGDECVGWCQFGSPCELPRIHNKRAYLATDSALPDWRITCFFAGKGHRGTGVAAAAIKGAVEQIRKLGGGRIEGFPDNTEGRKASAAFLFNGALSTFERLGFKRSRQIGKHKWVVTRSVRAAR
ncbi:MAG: GNAT family N-acetyltransferase [Pseudomonadaceae bacterium]|nr:GNAT family N-acetyltransferase [Pseudomonadaceae bacterium]